MEKGDRSGGNEDAYAAPIRIEVFMDKLNVFREDLERR
jgi:hypothetical protein